MKHRPLVFLDIETTGLSAGLGRITEIGALRIEDHAVVASFKQLINPEIAIPPFITRLTGITNEMLWDSPTFKAIADDLEVFLDGALFVAHNVNFDYSFIKAEFERLGNRFAMDRMCTAKLSKRLYPEHRSHALDRIIERMNLEVANRHRAYDDAEVLWKFFDAEFKRHDVELFKHVNKLTTYAHTVKSSFSPDIQPKII